MHKLTEKGVEVIGVSGDSIKTHELFKKAQMLNFTLLADEHGTVLKQFGVPVGPGATVKAKGADGNPFEFKRNVRPPGGRSSSARTGPASTRTRR
jgi:peroxiredoxin Q/BCP